MTSPFFGKLSFKNAKKCNPFLKSRYESKLEEASVTAERLRKSEETVKSLEKELRETESANAENADASASQAVTELERKLTNQEAELNHLRHDLMRHKVRELKLFSKTG